MPGFEKSPPALIERFAAIADETAGRRASPDVRLPLRLRRREPDHGLHQRAWFVRLADDDAAALAAIGGGSFEPMPGRPMRGYTTMPPAVVDDDAAVRRWVDRAIDHGLSLPLKVKKPAKGR